MENTPPVHSETPNEGLASKIEARLMKVFIPFYLSFLYLLALYFILGPRFYPMMYFMGVYLIPPWGKESAIPGAILIGGVPWPVAALSIAFMDFAAGLFMMWNFDLALKIPLLGRWIEGTEKRGQRYLENHPWIRKGAFIFVVMFVMFPAQGSGGIGGTILGRIIGMEKHRVLAAITIGALLGSFTIAMFAESVKEALTHDIQTAVTVVVVIMVLVFIMYLWRRGSEI